MTLRHSAQDRARQRAAVCRRDWLLNSTQRTPAFNFSSSLLAAPHRVASQHHSARLNATNPHFQFSVASQLAASPRSSPLHGVSPSGSTQRPPSRLAIFIVAARCSAARCLSAPHGSTQLNEPPLSIFIVAMRRDAPWLRAARRSSSLRHPSYRSATLRCATRRPATQRYLYKNHE